MLCLLGVLNLLRRLGGVCRLYSGRSSCLNHCTKTTKQTKQSKVAPPTRLARVLAQLVQLLARRLGLRAHLGGGRLGLGDARAELGDALLGAPQRLAAGVVDLGL